MRERPFVSVPDLAVEVLMSRMGARNPGREEYSNDVILDVVPQDKLSVLSSAGLGDDAPVDESE